MFANRISILINETKQIVTQSKPKVPISIRAKSEPIIGKISTFVLCNKLKTKFAMNDQTQMFRAMFLPAYESQIHN